MDDLFQYLIYGLIIFSFLSSFFKKKEPPKPPLPGTKPNDTEPFPDREQNVNVSEVAKKQDQYDILKEIENLFKDKVNVPQQKNPAPQKVDPYDIYESSKIKDMDLDLKVDERMQQDVMDHNPIGYRKAYDQNKYVKKSLDKKTEEEAEKFKKVLTGLNTKINFESKIKKKLNSSATLKDYIIFSEILGKPKALRR